MSGPGITVAGGGSTAVDTAAMQDAAQRLATVRDAIAALRLGLGACLGDPAWSAGAHPIAHAAVLRADDAARAIADAVDEAERGLRLAADRYGAVERTVTAVQQDVWAGGAALAGATTRLGLALVGPGFLVLPATLAGLATGTALTAAAARELLTTGRIDPQVDPAVLATLRRALSSTDDLMRGFLLEETPADVVTDDPASPHGTASTAQGLGAVLTTSGGPIALRTSTLPGGVDGPGTLAELGERTPEVDPGGTQLRLERYPMADGRSRWIVYVCGTITFSPDAGDEPFDLGSDLRGVGGQRGDSERALAAAMRTAGVRADDPVLLVGHSQGALDAVRLAQRGDFDVQGVVTLGGPTGQLVLPPQVPELSVEHDEDVVPVLGGAAATGAAGLHRLVVRRSLYADVPPPGPPVLPFGAGAAPHALTEYRRTLALADASPDPRIQAFERQVRPFLTARDGRIVLVRADRVRPPRDRRGDGGRAR